MTPNRRIFLNIVATYGRSLYALVIGLFTARWALQALGQVDYGLYGVVGGLTVFISFFNGILSSSIGRFYAYSVGAAKRVGNESAGMLECQKWFTIAVSVHTVVPIVLIVVGYPIGVWAVRHWLTIPADRVADCIWIFRFVCFTCFCGMVSVPFQAMYTAKQEIAELTIYSFITSTLNAGFLYYMMTHPDVWLVRYGLWMAFLAVAPMLIITARAKFVYRECRIRKEYLWNLAGIKELVNFAGWNFFGSLGNLLKGAGMSIAVNKYLGPTQNAAVTIAQSASGHTQTLSSALVGAFMPAITNACGAGDRERMTSLIHSTCKFGAASVLPFAIPLALEIDEVMRLWLKTPPEGASGLCIWLMLILVLENMTTGHWVAIAANGKVAVYQLVVGLLFIATLPLACGIMMTGIGLVSVGYALLVTLAAVVVVRLVALKLLLQISPDYWLKRILFPLVVISVITLLFGALPKLWLAQSFGRVCLTAFICEVIMIPLVWLVALDVSERKFILTKLDIFLNKVRG